MNYFRLLTICGNAGLSSPQLPHSILDIDCGNCRHQTQTSDQIKTQVTLPINKGSGIEFMDFSSMYAKCAQV